jgi:hypothetical protein
MTSRIIVEVIAHVQQMYCNCFGGNVAVLHSISPVFSATGPVAAEQVPGVVETAARQQVRAGPKRPA